MAMKRSMLLLCLVVGTGCSTTNTKSEWADAMKDLRGENMQLRHSSSSLMSVMLGMVGIQMLSMGRCEPGECCGSSSVWPRC